MLNSKTVQKIQEAFYTVGKEKPADNITVRDLLEYADVSRSTFYTYYDNMMDLMIHLENQILEPISDYLEPHSSFSSARFTEVISRVLTYSKENGEKLLLLRNASDSRLLKKLYNILTQCFQSFSAESGKLLDDFELFFSISTLMNLIIPSALCPDSEPDVLAKEYISCLQKLLVK